MAKDSLSSNPVASHNKAIKARAIKRSKQAQQSTRDDKLSTRKTGYLERRTDELKKAQEAGAGQANQQDGEELARLERDLGMIQKAKKRKGVDDAPTNRNDDSQASNRSHRDKTTEVDGNTDGSILGKRRRPELQTGGQRSTNPNLTPMVRSSRFQHHTDDSSDTDSDIGDISMPTDIQNMPPIPRRNNPENSPRNIRPNNVHNTAPPAPIQAVYESKAAVRDLKKEAMIFVPTAVQARMKELKKITASTPPSVAAGEAGSLIDNITTQVNELRAMVESDDEA